MGMVELHHHQNFQQMKPKIGNDCLSLSLSFQHSNLPAVANPWKQKKQIVMEVKSEVKRSTLVGFFM
jgi:hypothetical protein